LKKSYQPKKNIRAGRLVFGVIIAVMMLVVLFIVTGLFFKIETIEVTGTDKCEPDAVRAASGIEEGDILQLVNKVAAQRGLMSAMPYADAVEIYRKFPHTVEIRIVETTPLAYIPYQNANLLIDYRGMLLGDMGTPTSMTSLTRVTSAELKAPVEGTVMSFEREDLARSLQLLILELRDRELLPDVSVIDMNFPITFGYTDRFRVSLGTVVELGNKLDYLPVIMERMKQEEPNARGMFDLSELENGGKTARFIPE
jgi:cell division protein FtsQ